MRCLGIDYGTRRIGLALGDDLGLATPLPALVDADEGEIVADSINMPIPHREFQRMARYGKAGQKAVLILYRSYRRSEPAVPSLS